MIQRMISMPQLLTTCNCGRQPKQWYVQGKNLYFLDCPPCGAATARHPDARLAIEEWEAMQHTGMREAAA